MKKKTVLFIVTLLTVSSVISGCGKKNEQKEAERYYQNELGLTKEEAKSLSEEIAHEKEINDKLEKEHEEYEAEQERLEKEKEDILSEYKIYPRNPEWDDITRDDGSIQIDETIITPGMTAREALAKLDKSEVEYEYRYKADNDNYEPVTDEILNKCLKNKNFAILLYRNNIKWCSLVIRSCDLYAEENSVEPTPVLDSYVAFIYLMDDAIPYCRFFGGISPSEEITLDDLYRIKDVYFADTPDAKKYIYDKKETVRLKMDAIYLTNYKLYKDMGWKKKPTSNVYIDMIYNKNEAKFEKFLYKVNQ